MWGVGTAIHLSQWCLPSQPLVSAWDTVLSTDSLHFQSCTLCFAEGTREVERAVLFLALIRNGSHHPLEMGLKARVAWNSLRTKKGQGGKGGVCLLSLDLIRTGSMSVSLQVLSLFSSSVTPLPLSQTSPAFLHRSKLLPHPCHLCYLFSFSAIWVFCSVGLMSIKLQTPLTEADHDNTLLSSSRFLDAFSRRSGLNWHWRVVGQVQKHQALSEHPLELSAHVKTSSLGNLCDCTE